jgi:hypothetical protein
VRWTLDLALLLLVSACFASKILFLGVMILVAGLFFQIQARRTRLLIGSKTVSSSVGKRVRAGVFSILVTALAGPVLIDVQVPPGAFEKSSLPDSSLPIVIVLGLLSALLMIGLSVERRRR